MKEHNHGTTSNTDEVFRTFIGCRVRGMLQDCGLSGNVAIILVFECGWGLAFNSNGSHWTVLPEGVQRKLSVSKATLNDTKRELEHILELAGAKQ